MSNWFIDYETRSDADLTETGAWHYARHPSTEMLMVAIAKDDGPVLVWVPPEFCMEDDGLCCIQSDPGALELLHEWLQDDGPTYAHNAGFEVAVTLHTLSRTFPQAASFPFTRWRCTMTMARRANVPASLEKCAPALGLTDLKLESGHALIRRFSIPQKDGSWIHPRNDSGKFNLMIDYCRQDVVVERKVEERTRGFALTGWLLDIFHEDLRINARGMPVNLDALRKADALIMREVGPAREEFQRITGGLNPKQYAKLKEWFAANGAPDIQSVAADVLKEAKESGKYAGTPAGEAIDLLQKISFASVDKIAAMLVCAGPDDHMIRGSLQFYGAQATGRWSGRLHQPQNFKKSDAETPDIYADIIAGADKEFLELYYGRPLFSAIASSIRHFIQDLDGPMLSADYSAIEARILAWYAGEEWRLEVFRTHGKIYEASASQMFKVPYEEFVEHKKRTGSDHPLRHRGKVAELALGYQGADGALIAMGALDEGLTAEELPDIVSKWREANKNIRQLWWDCQRFAALVIYEPGRVFNVGKHGQVKMFCGEEAGARYFFIKLPSGRRLAYRHPEAEKVTRKRDDGSSYQVDSITHYGQLPSAHGKSQQWGRVHLYGGKIVENIVQATAFDLMANGTLKAAAQGFQVFSLIHDEVLSKKLPGQTIEGLRAAMLDAPPWAAGLPLDASGGEVPFYMKD